MSENVTAKKRKPSTPNKLKPQQVLDLLQANPNLTTRQLGKLTDTDHSAIVKCFQRYGISQEHLAAYKTNRADVLAGLQEITAASLTEDDIKKASVRDRTILLGTLYDKERLERGLSTSNAAIVYASALEGAFAKSLDIVVDNSPTPANNTLDVEVADL